MENTKKSNLYVIGILAVFLIVVLGVFLFNWYASTDWSRSLGGETSVTPEDTSETKRNETELYKEHLQDILKDEISSCQDSKESTGVPLKAYLENNIDLCSESQTENCRRKYHRYKMLAEDFSNCENVDTEKERRMCEIIGMKEPEECSKIEEIFPDSDMSEEACLSIVNENIKECEGLGPYAKRACWFLYYLYKGKNEGPEKCEKLMDFPTNEFVSKEDFNVRDYYDFSTAHWRGVVHECKAFANNDYTIYEDYMEEKCQLDTVVARVNPVACEEEVKDELQEECKDRIEKLVDCLDSDKTLKAKKTCVEEYTNRDFFCAGHLSVPFYAKNIEGVKESINLPSTSRDNVPLKRSDLIDMDPEICVI